MKLYYGHQATNIALLTVNKATYIIDKSSNEIIGKRNISDILRVVGGLGLNFELYRDVVFDVKVISAVVQLTHPEVLIGEQDSDVKVLGMYPREAWNKLKNTVYSDTLMTVKYKLRNMRKDFDMNDDYVEYLLILKR